MLTEIKRLDLAAARENIFLSLVACVDGVRLFEWGRFVVDFLFFFFYTLPNECAHHDRASTLDVLCLYDI